MEDKLTLGLRWLLKEKLGLTKKDAPAAELVICLIGSSIFGALTYLLTNDKMLTIGVSTFMLVFFGLYAIMIMVNKN
jgi:fluoride ion exporter CrcB/FEX